MPKQQPFNRKLVILGAILIQFNLGAIYAWSVFTPTLKAVGWSKLDTQFVFSLGLASFAVVMVFAGRAMAKYGPQKMAVAGGITLGAGYLLAGILGGGKLLGGGHWHWLVRRCGNWVGLCGANCGGDAVVSG